MSKSTTANPTRGTARPEQSFRSLLDAAPDAIVVIDRSGAILLTNAQAEKLFGYTQEELLGRTIEVLLPERFRDAHVRHRAAYCDAPRVRGMSTGVSLFGRRKDGSEFPAEVSLSPTFTHEGLRIVAAVRDIGERLRREQLEQQNERVAETSRLKNMFLANMSHELRTPLNAIIGFTELLHDEQVGALAPAQKDFLHDILASAQHLLGLINGMLDLATLEAGKMEFHPSRLQLAKLMAEVRDSVRLLAAQKQLELVLDVDPELPLVNVDALRLKQVLLNYVANAIKFTPARGRITMRARREGEHAFRVEVEDTGPGIPADQVDLLFVEFQQLDAGLARHHQGTGLGLALSKRIIEAQGGRIGVVSTEGAGSRFYAVLSREPGATKDPAASS